MGRSLVYFLIEYPIMSMVTLWALYYVALGAIFCGIIVYVRRQLQREDGRWDLDRRATVTPWHRKRVHAGGHSASSVERRNTPRFPIEPKDIWVSTEREYLSDWSPQAAGSNVEHLLLSRWAS